MLQHYSSVCRERLSPKIAVGRTCGEEFLLLLPFVSLEAAVQTMDQLRADFPPARIGECVAELASTFSAGLTEAWPRTTGTPFCSARIGPCMPRKQTAATAPEPDRWNSFHALEPAARTILPRTLVTLPSRRMEPSFPALVARELNSGGLTLREPATAGLLRCHNARRGDNQISFNRHRRCHRL